MRGRTGDAPSRCLVFNSRRDRQVEGEGSAVAVGGVAGEDELGEGLGFGRIDVVGGVSGVFFSLGVVRRHGGVDGVDKGLWEEELGRVRSITGAP